MPSVFLLSTVFMLLTSSSRVFWIFVRVHLSWVFAPFVFRHEKKAITFLALAFLVTLLFDYTFYFSLHYHYYAVSIFFTSLASDQTAMQPLFCDDFALLKHLLYSISQLLIYFFYIRKKCILKFTFCINYCLPNNIHQHFLISMW